MRRQHFYWTYLVISLLLITYGGYFLYYGYKQGKGLSIYALIALCLGGALLILYVVLYLISMKQVAKKATEKKEEPKKEDLVVDAVYEEPEEVAEETSKPVDRTEYVRRETRNRSRYDDDSGYFAYIKQVGYGPVLEISGNNIKDMRSNTYYQIEGNSVYRNGSGLVYEISGGRIRNAFGGYLYEISGDSINKVFGGYVASISGRYITKYDLSEKYEMTNRLSDKQILVSVVLLLGEY